MSLEIIGYSVALVIGLALGLIGGGGSIITVPVLVYLMNLPPVIATGYSLFVVGSTSLIGAYINFKKGNIDVKSALIFAAPSLIAVLITRQFILPAMPDKILPLNSFIITKDIFLMVVFSILMIAVSISMIKQKSATLKNEGLHNTNFSQVFIQGSLVGFISGLIGAGGGFLIIPALVMFLKLPMKVAIGTSLLIIAINSLIGFAGDLFTDIHVDWNMLLLFTSISIVGVFIGTQLSHSIPGEKLKPAFGWFVLVMGISIMTKELINAKF